MITVIFHFMTFSSLITTGFLIQQRFWDPMVVAFLFVIAGIFFDVLFPGFLIMVRNLHRRKMRRKAEEAGKTITWTRGRLTYFRGWSLAIQDANAAEGCFCIFFIIAIIAAIASFVFGMYYFVLILVWVVIPIPMIAALIYDVRDQQKILQLLLEEK